MFRSVGVAGSTSEDNTISGISKNNNVILSQSGELHETRYWKPPALRAPLLILTIAICWSLIALLEFLLWKSQRDSGLLFAPVIHELSLSDTFLYLYFPTILAVLFSIYWAWIDLETKRMEPYYQLTQENGALGKDSLLLHYPFSFIPLAPVKAFRDRHWPVFWASFAVVLVTWGLVPTQAGIFSVETVTRTTNMTFAVSTSAIPYEKQAKELDVRYAQSVYGIVAANETLPPYMTRNYTLVPFKPRADDGSASERGTYTAPTIMYTLDLECEDVSHKSDNSTSIVYKSKGGCNVDLGLDGNLTMGHKASKSEWSSIKQYTGMYIGYHNGGLADYYLSPLCPKSENTTFYAAFAKSKARPEDPPQDVTAIFCKPRYWRQEVSATVDTITKAPLKVLELAEKQPMEWDTFNTTEFEMNVNAGSGTIRIRSDAMPEGNFPKYWDIVARSNLTLTSKYGDLMPMVGLAVGTGNGGLEDYVGWQGLSKAYTDAYRLLFVRAMVDVLDTNFSSTKEASGQRQAISEAVVLQGLFVHIVVGFLGVVSIATIMLLILSLRRKRNLQTDPSTIASIMAMVANDTLLLSKFADLDCSTLEDLEKVVGPRRYKLNNDESGTNLSDITCADVTDFENGPISSLQQRRDRPSNIVKPVRPLEFSLWLAIPVISLFSLLAIMLGVVYAKARANGLPLPSKNTIVQNILENYIPTAIATLIEPMWILINRLLCLLQPIEELQNCNAKANQSIDTNYSSLPPQLVVFQALRSKHFVLAAVCTMALLANVLAVAFAGLFNQETVNMRHATTFQQLYEPSFASINGNVGPEIRMARSSIQFSPSGAYQGGDGLDVFLITESNLTRNTSLPAWTDSAMFYMPIFDEALHESPSETAQFEAQTTAIGADLDCSQLRVGQNFDATMKNGQISMNVTILDDSGTVSCSSFATNYLNPCMDEPSALEVLVSLAARQNATKREEETCMSSVILGWMRFREGECSGFGSVSIRQNNALFLICRPRLLARPATIRVDARGRLQVPGNHAKGNFADQFNTDNPNVLGQSNKYIFLSLPGFNFHNNSFAADYLNHFIRRVSNDRLLDPSKPVPTLEDVMGPLNKAYSKLFAVWLGRNKERLFVPTAEGGLAPIPGSRLEPEQRVFLSATMFIISEAILCTYVFVAVWVYARRPGRYLARMPTSLASIIALFAASTAVEDMQGTAHLDRKGRARHLEELGARYGYGSFIGAGDGRIHIGIEKVPLVVKPRMNSTWLEQKLPLLRKRTGG
ncbi:hypothetical protein BDU57DRAFT_511601 [Ampelomyces quisqualis]|uniref:Uncharacterized protein n=1 Tax=Ampelomyces quisqualis TaxID=50730 RepID=A0A6A5QT56_AMPQU|nr:hypothetical protein BDU57DRAFT_511601 [Ampelomyces quisqualis]